MLCNFDVRCLMFVRKTLTLKFLRNKKSERGVKLINGYFIGHDWALQYKIDFNKVLNAINKKIIHICSVSAFKTGFSFEIKCSGKLVFILSKYISQNLFWRLPKKYIRKIHNQHKSRKSLSSLRHLQGESWHCTTSVRGLFKWSRVNDVHMMNCRPLWQ